jgi:hypothetical protein
MKKEIDPNTEEREMICKCYVDLHGLQKGKFIHVKKPMISKEFTESN